jgi:hypothetical protein
MGYDQSVEQAIMRLDVAATRIVYSELNACKSAHDKFDTQYNGHSHSVGNKHLEGESFWHNSSKADFEISGSLCPEFCC